MENTQCNYESWLRISTHILLEKHDKTEIICPCCRNKGVDFQCIGNIDTKIGFMLLWCWKCRQGINISRIKIPDGTPMLSMDISDEEYSNRIPKFELIKN
jgi:hypothetical protein